MDSPVGRLLSLLFHERKVFPQVDFCVRAVKSVESRNFGLVPREQRFPFIGRLDLPGTLWRATQAKVEKKKPS